MRSYISARVRSICKPSESGVFSGFRDSHLTVLTFTSISTFLQGGFSTWDACAQILITILKCSWIADILCTYVADLSKAKLHMERLVASLPTHITSMSFSSYQLVQMVAINLFALQHARRKLDTGEAETGSEEKAEEARKMEELGKEEKIAYDMIFRLTGVNKSTFDDQGPETDCKCHRDYAERQRGSHF